LAAALLPDEVPLLGEARRLKDRRHRLFHESGGGQEEIREINSQLKALREEARGRFPLSPEATAEFRAALREHVVGIHQKEQEAVEVVRTVMST
jgi:hypothetical protein